ncbi:DUF935 family protein [Cryobacterium sp. TMT2-15-1]|uniref:phage portal protein family protein n=1 Tax=Cryobacterium sp. TMT2-15-1 TaxID=1259246 RepID=UPI00106BA713|nr:DUF935 family protein [Cryobacterium sp. TMT2-15-1]TFC63724.1 DUF935 family protein [Cryobacterium sp. TMT2-15-1]
MASIEVKVITSKESGKSGTTISSGQITGEEYNFNLRDDQAMKTYNEMRSNDATVEASLAIVKTPVLAADFTVDPASDEDADKEVADFVYDCLRHIIDWDQFIGECLTYLEFGFSLFEADYKPRVVNGKLRIALVKLAYRKQTTIKAWETADGKPGVTQHVGADRFSISQVKLVRFTNRQEGDNYVGRSILRPAYKHWYMKDKLYKIDAVGHERQALGVLDITVPKGATDLDKQRIRAAARALRASENSFIEHPENWIIQFLDMKAKSMKDTEPSINHHDRQIMKNVLAAFMEIGAAGSSGTRSTSEDQSTILEKAVENIAKYIVNVLQNTVVRNLVDLNFTDRDYPTLRVSKTSDDNVPVLSEAVAKYTAAGVLHARPTDENTVRKQLGWAQVPVDDLEEDYKKPELKPVEKVDANLTASIRELKALRASVEKALYAQPPAAA